MELAEHLGEDVKLEGVAYDAHSGAIVEVNGVPVYLDGVARWPRGVYGMATTVAGRLTRRSLAPEPTPPPVVTHGMEGEAYVLEDPQCELLAEE